MSSFNDDRSLVVVDLDFKEQAGFTFFLEADGCHSWIDHVVTCQYLHSMITDICSLKFGYNLSDYAPILVELNFGTPTQSIPKVDGQGPSRRANWHRATLEQK